MANLSRGSHFDHGNGSLAWYDELEALWAAGNKMDEAGSRIEVNRVYSSLDPDDLSEWPAEFREGGSADGAPILKGAETIVTHTTDCWVDDYAPMGRLSSYDS